MTTPITEQQLLAQSALPYFGKENDDPAFFRQMAKVGPGRFVDQAICQGMAGLLYHRLLNAGVPHGIPRAETARLRRIYLATAAGNVSRMRDLAEILIRSNEAEIPVVILKGMSLLESVYADPGLRPMEDMDLWVIPDQLDRLSELLYDLDYQSDPIYPGTFKKRQTVVDIRAHLLDADRICARRHLLHCGQSLVHADTKPVGIYGATAKGLAAHDQILFLGIHALKHDVSRMIWLTDIFGAMQSWDKTAWQALVKRAKLWDQENSLTYILWLIWRLFGYLPPDENHHTLFGDRFHLLEKRALRQRIKRKALPPWSPLVLYSTAKGLKGRLQYIFEMLFPRPQILRQVFRQRTSLPVPVLYLLRVAQLLSMSFARRR